MNIQEIPTKKVEKQRVCAYVRVSTDSDAQEDSFVFQSNYWQKRFENDESVEYIGLFSDEGIGGAFMKKRDGLKRMFQKVRNGEIDRIYTKSVSRFARNKVELMEVVREFRDLGVEIIFESENIHTLDPKCGLILTVMASLAEEELLSMSQNQKWAARKRFANGSVELARILGYDMVDGKLVINEKKAVIVRRIFELYLQGNSFRTICHVLENEGYTPMHGGRWSKSTITGMLRNEKYCGDSIMQKSYSVMKVQKYNYGELPKYYIQDDHEPIVSREDYQKAQEIMMARGNKYRPRGSPTALYPLSGKLICGECGTSFKRKTSAHGTPYMCIKWTCRKKDVYGVKECTSHDIKDEVVTRLLIEAYNESLDANNDVNGITEQEEVLRKLIANEQELRQLRAKGYISESKCREETDKILIKIKEQETLIKNLRTRDMVKGKYKKSDELTEQMAEFLVKATIKDWTITFEFQNGYKTTKEYTNGRAGNVNGKLCKH